MKSDNWEQKGVGMLCKTCMYFVPKADEGEIVEVGRCRRHAPTMNGWPVMFVTDWCGDHKLDKDRLPVKDPYCFVAPEDIVKSRSLL